MKRRRIAGGLASAAAVFTLSTGTALAASPTAMWHLDEKSGSIASDATGHGYNGAIKNVKLGVPGKS